MDIQVNNLTFDSAVRPVMVPVRKQIFQTYYVVAYRTSDGQVFNTEEEAEFHETWLAQQEDLKEYFQYREEPALREYKQCHTSDAVNECYSVVVPDDPAAMAKLKVLQPLLPQIRLEPGCFLITVQEDYNYSGLSSTGGLDLSIEVYASVYKRYLQATKNSHASKT